MLGAHSPEDCGPLIAKTRVRVFSKTEFQREFRIRWLRSRARGSAASIERGILDHFQNNSQYSAQKGTKVVWLFVMSLLYDAQK